MTSQAQAPGLPGVWPALMTPLAADLSIDHAKFVAHARRLLEAGCAGVTPFGTTGEGPSFSVAERRAAVEALVAGGIPAARILVSVSCAAVPDTLALVRHAQDIGAWGVLLMPPFFFKGVSDDGIVESYREVFEFKEFWGIGSGRSFALGAMHAVYAKAKTAREVAEAGIAAGCEFDRNSATPCDIFTIKATKETK